MFTNQLRFTGLFSGMDTQGMVQQMMRAESMRMDRFSRRRQTLAWRQENFLETADILRHFQSHRLDLTRPNNVRSRDNFSSAFNTIRSSVTGVNGAGGVSVRAGMNASPGRFDVVVENMATNAAINGPVTQRTTNIPSSKKADLSALNPTFENEEYHFNIQLGNEQPVRNIVLVKSQMLDADGEVCGKEIAKAISAQLLTHYGTLPAKDGDPRVWMEYNNGDFTLRTLPPGDTVRLTAGAASTDDETGRVRRNALAFLGFTETPNNLIKTVSGNPVNVNALQPGAVWGAVYNFNITLNGKTENISLSGNDLTSGTTMATAINEQIRQLDGFMDDGTPPRALVTMAFNPVTGRFALSTHKPGDAVRLTTGTVSPANENDPAHRDLLNLLGFANNTANVTGSLTGFNTNVSGFAPAQHMPATYSFNISHNMSEVTQNPITITLSGTQLDEDNIVAAINAQLMAFGTMWDPVNTPPYLPEHIIRRVEISFDDGNFTLHSNNPNDILTFNAGTTADANASTPAQKDALVFMGFNDGDANDAGSPLSGDGADIGQFNPPQAPAVYHFNVSLNDGTKHNVVINQTHLNHTGGRQAGIAAAINAQLSELGITAKFDEDGNLVFASASPGDFIRLTAGDFTLADGDIPERRNALTLLGFGADSVLNAHFNPITGPNPGINNYDFFPKPGDDDKAAVYHFNISLNDGNVHSVAITQAHLSHPSGREMGIMAAINLRLAEIFPPIPATGTTPAQAPVYVTFQAGEIPGERKLAFHTQNPNDVIRLTNGAFSEATDAKPEHRNALGLLGFADNTVNAANQMASKDADIKKFNLSDPGYVEYNFNVSFNGAMHNVTLSGGDVITYNGEEVNLDLTDGKMVAYAINKQLLARFGYVPAANGSPAQPKAFITYTPGEDDKPGSFKMNTQSPNDTVRLTTGTDAPMTADQPLRKDALELLGFDHNATNAVMTIKSDPAALDFNTGGANAAYVFNITLNGNSHTITLTGEHLINGTSVAAAINEQLRDRFGNVPVTGGGSSTQRVEIMYNEGAFSLYVNNPTDTVRLNAGTPAPGTPTAQERRNALEQLGFANGTTNAVNHDVKIDSFLGLTPPNPEPSGVVRRDATPLPSALVPEEWPSYDQNGWVFAKTEPRQVPALTECGKPVMSFVSVGTRFEVVNMGTAGSPAWHYVQRDEHGEVTVGDSFTPTTANLNNMSAVHNSVHEPVYTQAPGMTINNVNINLYSNDSVRDVMNRINASSAGVNMAFDGTSNRYVLTSKTVGMGSQIKITRDAGGFLAKTLGFNAEGDENTSAQGKNAQVRIYENGGTSSILRDFEGNTFTHNNVAVTINGTQALGERFIIEVSRDTTQTLNAIRDFVQSYNDLINGINLMHSTPRPRTNTRAFFEPLTDAERNALSDRDVERWEEQARIGLLHRDPTLRNIHNQMRQWMTAGVRMENGDTLFLHQIGITTESIYRDGRLVIDEERLRSALEEDPDRVMNLFTHSVPGGITSTVAGRSALIPQEGLAQRLNHIIDNAISRTNGSITAIAGFANADASHQNRLNRQMAEYDRRMENMTQWLIRRENNLYAMFSRVEIAMARSQQQMDSLWMFGNQ
ncbi:MAG: flagellar filament capping protein FliD [Defluviitaleaceae bacterium]|nr:flagellar filament capping protein FliD [Defluviitaleaceae bacterium]